MNIFNKFYIPLGVNIITMENIQIQKDYMALGARKVPNKSMLNEHFIWFIINRRVNH